MIIKRIINTLIPLIIVGLVPRVSNPKGMLLTMRIVLAASFVISMLLACGQDSAPKYSTVTPETEDPSEAPVTSAIPSATPQSVVPTSPLPTPTAPSATATLDTTPVVPTPTTPPSTAAPDTDSVIAGLTVGPLRVHNLEPFDSEVDSSWLQEMLSLMPDSETVREAIWMQNMLPIWKYYESHGYFRPTVDDGHEGYYNYFVEIPRPQDGVPLLPQISRDHMPWISGITDYMFSASTFSTMGFDPRNVDYAAAGGKPPIVLEAVVGAYDPDITRASLAECADCMPHEEFRHSGHEYYSWGEDFKGKLQERLAPPAYDYVGRGGRISVQQGRVLRAVYTEGIHSLIDAAAGAGDSLWDSEDMRQVAQAMADLGAYAVSYTEADMSLATLTPLYEKPTVEFIPPIEYSVSRLTDPPALLPFRAIGSGYGLTSLDNPPHVFLVVVHDSDDAARANAVRLAARLQEGVSLLRGIPFTELIQRIEMEIRGALLLVRLEQVPGAKFPSAFQTHDWYPFVVHE